MDQTMDSGQLKVWVAENFPMLYVKCYFVVFSDDYDFYYISCLVLTSRIMASKITSESVRYLLLILLEIPSSKRRVRNLNFMTYIHCIQLTIT